ncbi:hypothetical protein DEO72_LG3g581 [Vigna unguiculata]|uniref:Uncharacterized protein n=1 Tax=Vigna unguiculata TaxID=3917 RepID=A0A4D6LC56_VIGUN|nr:hypothetical protein DEO72_LG3g581 [Vigna unguiculata]
MNLPAHGTTSPNPSKASFRLAHQPAPPGETSSDRLAVYVPPPGARFSNKSSLPRVRLADLTSPPGARRQPLQTTFLGLRPPSAPSPAAKRCDSTFPLIDFASFPAFITSSSTTNTKHTVAPLFPPPPGGRLNTAERYIRIQKPFQVAEPAIYQVVQNSTYTPQPVSHDESHLIHCPSFL